MKKTIFLSSIIWPLASLFVSVPFISAHESHNNDYHTVTVSETMETVLSAHGVESISNLGCDDLSDAEWEQLGEAVMNEAHPDVEEHEAMDEMMALLHRGFGGQGGEESESLEAAHIAMTKRYMGCASTGMGVMGMFGGMMGGLYSDYGSMMNSGFAWGYGLLTAALYIAGIATLVAIARYYWKKGNEMK